MEDNTKNNSQNAPYDLLRLIKVYLEDVMPNDPSFRNYLLNRLGDQLTWYDGKSAKIKQHWVRRRVATIVLSALIPFAVGYIGAEGNSDELNTSLKVFVGTAGVAIAIMEALNSLFKSQELYIDYRVTAEQLKQEFSFFVGKAGDYSGDLSLDAPKLVGKLENIMAAQNSKWMEVVRRNEEATNSEAIQRKLTEERQKQGLNPPSAQPPMSAQPASVDNIAPVAAASPLGAAADTSQAPTAPPPVFDASGVITPPPPASNSTSTSPALPAEGASDGSDDVVEEES